MNFSPVNSLGPLSGQASNYCVQTSLVRFKERNWVKEISGCDRWWLRGTARVSPLEGVLDETVPESQRSGGHAVGDSSSYGRDVVKPPLL